MEKRRKVSQETFVAVRKKDINILDVLKKRRGRKKFIMIDQRVRERLNKRESKFLDKV